MTDRNTVARRLGYDPLADDERAVPPNPLVMANAHEKTTLCSVVSGEGPCPNFTAYVDSFRETGLCILHAKAINDLPDSIAKRQATVEMAVTSLTNMTTEAINTIGQIMMDPNAPEGVRIKAADLILSKAGFVSGARIEITANERAPHAATAGDLIRDRLNRLVASAENVVMFPNGDNPHDDQQETS